MKRRFRRRVEAVVEVRDFRKRYGSVEAVRGVTFTIPRGEIFGILGPNGAGKSTTIRALYGAAEPTSGSLRVLGVDVTHDARAVKKRLGIVPQELNLEDVTTALDNLLTHARYFDLHGADAHRRALDALDGVNLRERANDRVSALSGGMRRRLLIARAVVTDPELLILDEPTTGLDPQSRGLLWERIRSMRDEGRTVLLTTHYMDEAEKLCDRLVIIDHGVIIAEGAPRALIEREIGREVVEIVADARAQEEALRIAGERALGHDRFGDTLHLYTRDGEALLARIAEGRVEVRSAVYRRASLEDVFLKLTGRRLEE